MKKALVLGGGGFIGSHMVRRLKQEGYWVRAVDLKLPDFSKSSANEFLIGDLRDAQFVDEISTGFDEIYQFAADMGGAGYIFTGDHDADVMHNSATINLNVLNSIKKNAPNTKIFYSSSACIYPEHNQMDPDNPNCEESSAYPANPDSEYGWEKLFSERLYFSFHRNYGIKVRVARYHNIFGPEGTWKGGKEKAPAAICRKVAMASNGDPIEIWGDGEQTRSFLYIDECIEATRRLMDSDFIGPVNIGSEEMVSINQLVDLASSIEEKNLIKTHVPGPTGVRGRNSNNNLIRQKLNWNYSLPLSEGIKRTYNWIVEKINESK
jgi:nucleoside-diphosphate-sugar epimerase